MKFLKNIKITYSIHPNFGDPIFGYVGHHFIDGVKYFSFVRRDEDDSETKYSDVVDALHDVTILEDLYKDRGYKIIFRIVNVIEKMFYRLSRIDDLGNKVYMYFEEGTNTPYYTSVESFAFTAPLEEIKKWKTPAWEIEEVPNEAD